MPNRAGVKAGGTFTSGTGSQEVSLILAADALKYISYHTDNLLSTFSISPKHTSFQQL